MLKRYWFIVYPADRFGPKNIGVTANSKAAAISFIRDAFAKSRLNEVYPPVDETTETIENINIQFLDQNHVIPNIGVVIMRSGRHNGR